MPGAQKYRVGIGDAKTDVVIKLEWFGSQSQINFNTLKSVFGRKSIDSMYKHTFDNTIQILNIEWTISNGILNTISNNGLYNMAEINQSG